MPLASNKHTHCTFLPKQCRCGEDSFPAAKILKHDSLYFTKGDIVLLSLPKDHVITAFKVYKDFLTLHSPVFEEMFSLPSPPSLSVENFDDVPLAHIHDCAEDLVPFLNAIYDPTSYSAIPSIRDFYFSFEKVEAVFKLSEKYQFSKLLKCMRETLSTIWPKTLWLWDSLIDNPAGHVTFLMDEYDLESPFPEPCGAIRLARDYDVPEILPAAFYFLLRLSPEVFSATDSKGSRVSLGVKPKLTHLSYDDLLCFIQGSHATQRFAYEFFTDSTCVPAADCTTRTKCSKVFKNLCEAHILKAAKSSHLQGDALEFLRTRNIDAYDKITERLCEECCDELKSSIWEWRADLWKTLPDFFKFKTE